MNKPNEQTIAVKSVASGVAPGVGAMLGQYRILRKIGQGGMGAVYEAEHVMLHRHFAVKTLSMGAATEAEREDEVKRFLQEARLVAQLRHPSIVGVQTLEQDAETGILYFAMDYVAMSEARRSALLLSAVSDAAVWSGGYTETDEQNLRPLSLEDLARYARKVGHPINTRLLRRILLDICGALSYAHGFGSGIIHRDIKPANILIRPDGRAVLADFGVAKVADSRLRRKVLRHQERSLSLRVEADGSSYHLILGTMEYMAPELRAGAPPSPRTDLYALGMTAYQLLTGELPSAVQTAPSSFGCPKVWDRPIMRCLASDPRHRWPDVASFRRALAGMGRRQLVRRVAVAGVWLLAAVAAVGFLCLVWSALTGGGVRRGLWVPQVPEAWYLTFHQTGGGVVLSRVHPDFCGRLELRSAYGLQRLVTIAPGAFSDCTHLTAVTAPKGIRVPAFTPASRSARAVAPPVRPADPGVIVRPGDKITSDGLRFVGLEGNEWALAGFEPGMTGVVTVPARVGGAPVTAVADHAFDRYSGPVTEIRLSEGIRHIGFAAFWGSSFQKIVLPEGLETIGDEAFTNAAAESLTLPSTLRELGRRAFVAAYRLKQIPALPAGLTRLGSYAYDGLDFRGGILRVPPSLKVLEGPFAWHVHNLTAVEMPGVREVRSDALREMYAGAVGNNRPMRLIFGEREVTFASQSVGIMNNAAPIELSFPRGAKPVFASDALAADAKARLLIEGEPPKVWIGRGWQSEAEYEENLRRTLVVEGPCRFKRMPEGGLSLIGFEGNPSGTVTVPARVKGNAVTQVAERAFVNYRGAVTELRLPEGVVSLGNRAFYGASFRRIILPDTLRTIGSEVFAGCALETMTLPEGLETIGTSLFHNCIRLKTPPKLPDGLRSLGMKPYTGCRFDNATLTLPAGLEAMPPLGLGWWVTGVKQIVLPSVRRVSARAFAEIPKPADANLRVVFGRKDVRFEAGAGDGQFGRTLWLIFPAGAEPVFESGAFGPNASVRLQIGDEPVRRWEDGAWVLERDAKSGTTAVGAVAWDWKRLDDGTLRLMNCTGSADLERIEVPAQINGRTVTELEAGALAGRFRRVTELILPKTLRYAGSATFLGMSSLRRVTVPVGLTGRSGGKWLFQWCVALEEVIIDGAPEYLASWMFSHCRSLRRVIVDGDRLPVFGDGVFEDTPPAGIEIVLRGSGKRFQVGERLGFRLLPAGETLPGIRSPENGDGLSYTVRDDGTVRIDVFRRCGERELRIPDSLDGFTVTHVAARAAVYSPGIHLVTVPETVVDIGSEAFARMPDLREVSLPASLSWSASDRFGLFASCDRLETVRMGSVPDRFPKDFFSGCTALRRLLLGGDRLPDNLPVALPKTEAGVEVILCESGARFLVRDGTLEKLPPVSPRSVSAGEAERQGEAQSPVTGDEVSTPEKGAVRIDNCTYRLLNDGSYALTEISSGDIGGVLEIPATLSDGRPVQRVARGAFVTLPEGVVVRFGGPVMLMPGAFDRIIPLCIDYPRGAQPWFCVATFPSGKVPDFTADGRRQTLLREVDGVTYLHRNNACWIYDVRSGPAVINVPAAIDRVPVAGILPGALRAAKTLRTLWLVRVRPTFEWMSGALAGAAELRMLGLPDGAELTANEEARLRKECGNAALEIRKHR